MSYTEADVFAATTAMDKFRGGQDGEVDDPHAGAHRNILRGVGLSC